MAIVLPISPIPQNALLVLLRYLLQALSHETSSNFDPNQHFCSLISPCRVAWSAVVLPFLSLRLVSSAWDIAVLATLDANTPQKTFSRRSFFFRRIEDAYYPHAWHVNTKVRKHAVSNRFRIFKTISSEGGDRGVYLAYDFRSSDLGCLNADTVVVKAWSLAEDAECVIEGRIYRDLNGLSGVPEVIYNAQDSKCGVYAIVLQHLGPTLEDILLSLPENRFNEKLTLGVAIQMLRCYKQIHDKGIIHNGIKPANICLPPAKSSKSTLDGPHDQLYAIDFGLSYSRHNSHSLPEGRKANVIGNRDFLSVFGHHGVTQSQRDDLESLAYLLSFLSQGKLPWSYSSQRQWDPKLHQPQLWRLKMATPASVLFCNMDHSFIEFWKDIKGLAFGEVPDYNAMVRRFEICWENKMYGGRPGDVDWSAIVEGAGERVHDCSFS